MVGRGTIHLADTIGAMRSCLLITYVTHEERLPKATATLKSTFRARLRHCRDTAWYTHGIVLVAAKQSHASTMAILKRVSFRVIKPACCGAACCGANCALRGALSPALSLSSISLSLSLCVALSVSLSLSLSSSPQATGSSAPAPSPRLFLATGSSATSRPSLLDLLPHPAPFPRLFLAIGSSAASRRLPTGSCAASRPES